MVIFSGFGKYVPPHRETNAEVALRLGMTEAEIVDKSGVGCRFLAKDESASSMGLKALKEALADAGIEPGQLSGIIVSTFSGDYLFPNTASRLAKELHISECFAFDLQANCSGFQMGLSAGRDFLLANPECRYVAVVGLAKQSPYINPLDPESAFFFSDAGSAAILERVEGTNEGFLPSSFRTNTQNHEMVRLRAGGSSFPFTAKLAEQDPASLYYEHAGLTVWKEVIVEFPKILRKGLERVGWGESDVDLFLFHQANLKLLQFVMARLRIPFSKTITNVQDIGNTADASLGTVLYDAAAQGWFRRPGAKILMASVGAGFVYSVTPYRVPSLTAGKKE